MMSDRVRAGKSGAQGFVARSLVRAARSGALATVSADGTPHAALVTPATTGEGDVLLLLSALSAHTRALGERPACSLLVVGAPAETNPQTAPRVSLHGAAERLVGEDASAALARYVAIHPYAALYAGFGDFAVWRLRPRSALLVEGFGRARDLGEDALRVDDAVAALFRRDEAALRALAGPDTAAVDADGIDQLHPDGGTVRLPFDVPATDRAAFEAAVGRLAARRGVN